MRYNVWKFTTQNIKGHPAPFPDELPKRLIKLYSFHGDTVLDPFVGSGTTVRVAEDLSRKGIGYDLNPDYIKSSKNKMIKKIDELENGFLVSLWNPSFEQFYGGDIGKYFKGVELSVSTLSDVITEVRKSKKDFIITKLYLTIDYPITHPQDAREAYCYPTTIVRFEAKYTNEKEKA